MHNNEFFHKFLKFLELLCSFLSVLFWILLIYGFDEPRLATLSVMAALIHEGGHLCCLLYIGGATGALRGRLFGLSITNKTLITYKKELYLYASGIMANIAFALLSLPFFGRTAGYAELFCFFNLATALSNLLPVEGHDGYGILRTVMCYFGLYELFLAVFPKISFGITGLLCFFSLYLMERYDAGYWIFAVFLFSLLSGMKKTLN